VRTVVTRIRINESNVSIDEKANRPSSFNPSGSERLQDRFVPESIPQWGDGRRGRLTRGSSTRIAPSRPDRGSISLAPKPRSIRGARCVATSSHLISALARFALRFPWNPRRGHERRDASRRDATRSIATTGLSRISPVPQVVNQSEMHTWLLHVCVRRAACQIELNSRKRDRRVEDSSY